MSNFPRRNDTEIVLNLKDNLRQETTCLVRFLHLILELHRQSGWARLGHRSLFHFCTGELGLGRSDASSRSRIAYLCAKVPGLLVALESREITYTGVRILAPILTPENHLAMIVAVKGMTTRQIEDFRVLHEESSAKPQRGTIRHQVKPISVVQVQEQESAKEPGTKRALADSATAMFPSSAGPTSPVSSTPLASATPSSLPEAPPASHQVRLGLTLPQEIWAKFEKVCELSGKPATAENLVPVFDMLVDEYLKRHDPVQVEARAAARRAARGEEPVALDAELVEEKPMTHSQCVCEQPPVTRHTRYVGAPIRRRVWLRDGGQCTYVDGETGRRCDCRTGLQIDHVVPYALGGSSCDVENLRLFCPVHNRLAADDVFGSEFVKERISVRRRAAADNASFTDECSSRGWFS